MTDMLDLAIRYGGYTSLDRVYLQTHFQKLSPKQQLEMIAPPPSVVNAYFAEIYQKQGPKEATDYYLELSKVFGWFQSDPSFEAEQFPFIRLNISGTSYGMVFENEEQRALVFSEVESTVTPYLLMELAKIFPHYKVFLEQGRIYMMPIKFDEEGAKKVDLPHQSLLTEAYQLKGNLLKVTGYNQDDLLEVLEVLNLNLAQTVYYSFYQRNFVIYLRAY